VGIDVGHDDVGKLVGMEVGYSTGVGANVGAITGLYVGLAVIGAEEGVSVGKAEVPIGASEVGAALGVGVTFARSTRK